MMGAMKWNDQIVHLAHHEGAPEDKIEFDNNGNLEHAEHLHTLKLLKWKETCKYRVFGKEHLESI